MMCKGFTLIEGVFSLIIVALCTSFYIMLLSIIANENYYVLDMNDRSSIHQMRLLYALSEEQFIKEDMLSFLYFSKPLEYYFHEDKLLVRDGYQVFFTNLTRAYFKEESSCFYFYFQRTNEVEKKVLIGCE